MRIHEKTKQEVADHQHRTGCLWQPLSGTFPDDSTEKERPKTEQMQESETKEKDFEETQEPQNPMASEEPVAPAPEVPVPKTGDFWW